MYGSGGGRFRDLADANGVVRGGAGVMREGRDGLVEAAGAGLTETGDAGGGFLVDMFVDGLRELGFVGGAGLFMVTELLGDDNRPEGVFCVRILANLSASSFVTPS